MNYVSIIEPARCRVIFLQQHDAMITRLCMCDCVEIAMVRFIRCKRMETIVEGISRGSFRTVDLFWCWGYSGWGAKSVLHVFKWREIQIFKRHFDF